jgi:hypothetical protein
MHPLSAGVKRVINGGWFVAKKTNQQYSYKLLIGLLYSLVFVI